MIVLAKEPLPGRVKTRLTPPFTPVEAAALATAALADTLAAVFAAVRLSRSNCIRLEPVLVLDGSPGEWLESALEDDILLPVLPQASGDLDVRLAAAFVDATVAAAEPSALLLGMDTPQVTPGQLTDAVAKLHAPGNDAVLGLAPDGGWWALGLRRPDPSLLEGVPMSTAHTGVEQFRRLTGAGLAVAMLPSLIDVDVAEDAAAVARQAPQSQFAKTLQRISDPQVG